MNTISAVCDPRTSARIAAVLAELSSSTGGARFGTLHDDGVTYWQVVPGGAGPTGSARSTNSLAARSEPAHPTALGQVLLAHADDTVRNRVLTYELGVTPIGAPPDRLRSALSVARLSGVAVARTGSAGSALGVAVPVLGDNGRLVAGLEVGARNFDQVESVLPGLLAASRRILCEA